jgi:hypothetical protein
MSKQKVIINRGPAPVAFTANEQDIILAPEKVGGRWGWKRVPGTREFVLVRLEGGPPTPTQYPIPVGTEPQIAGKTLNQLLAKGCVIEDYAPPETQARSMLERAQQYASEAGAVVQSAREEVAKRDAEIADRDRIIANLERMLAAKPKAEPEPKAEEPKAEPEKGSTSKPRSK